MQRTPRLLHSRSLPRSHKITSPPFICHRCLATTTSCRIPNEDSRTQPDKPQSLDDLTASQKGALVRDKLLERVRRKIWKGTPPGPDDPYTGQDRPSRRPPAPSDEEKLTIGGDDAEVESIDDVRELERAARVQEAEQFQQQVDDAPTHKEYVPATSWEGMEVVGGEVQWDEGQGVKANKTFRGFLPRRKVMSPTLLGIALHRAAVEVWFAKSRGWDLMRLGKAEPGDVEVCDGVAHEVDLKPSETGVTMGLRGEMGWESLEAQVRALEEVEKDEENEMVESDVEEKLEDAVEEEELVAKEELEERPNPKRVLKSLGTEWHGVQITDPAIKLAISHRLTQLTSHVLPSPLLNHSKTLKPILDHITSSVQKPTTTFQHLMGTHTEPQPLQPTSTASQPLQSTPAEDEEAMAEVESTKEEGPVGPLQHEIKRTKGTLRDLPNVKVTGRRVTPIDKHVEVGRWKIIENELRERGLPVTGKGGEGGILKVRNRPHEYRMTR